MSSFIVVLRPSVLICLSVFFTTIAAGQANVLTYHYDNSRTGQNTQETMLNPITVQAGQFGKLFSQPVDGQVYAQPLYVAQLTISGKGAHNVIFVATEADSVYAFDADDNYGNNINPLWKVSLIDANHGVTVQSRPTTSGGCGGITSADLPCAAIVPNVGITSTPVIDISTNTMYVEAFSCEGTPLSGVQLSCAPNAQNPGIFRHRLHALDITTGNERFGGPVIVQPPSGVAGFNSNNSTNGNQMNRPGLLLSNGQVYVAYGSDGDDYVDGHYHGWIFAFDPRTLLLTSFIDITPNGVTDFGGPAGSIWMSGAGLAADTNGNIFVATANGTFDTTLNANGFPANNDFGDSLVKLDQNLHLVDYFTPLNEDTLNRTDQDLGSGGVLLLPDQAANPAHLLVQSGKEGEVFLVNRDRMGGFSSTANRIVQDLPRGTLGTQAPPPNQDLWLGEFGMPSY